MGIDRCCLVHSAHRSRSQARFRIQNLAVDQHQCISLLFPTVRENQSIPSATALARARQRRQGKPCSEARRRERTIRPQDIVKDYRGQTLLVYNRNYNMRVLRPGNIVE